MVAQTTGRTKMGKQKKRKIEVAVISDVHLGTFGCRAKELLNYLKTIDPQILVLNGDIIDIWQFNKRYFPKSHMKIIKHLTSLLSKGTKIYYITGNHDEMLRRFEGFQLGSLEVVNKIVLELDGQKAWMFHGDVFDVTMQHSKWLARLGAIGYDTLIIINTFVNWISENILRRGRLSLSKKIKNSVKTAVKHINNFEDTAAEIAISSQYDYVICGHIHQPQMRIIKNKEGQVTYLNSGDWIENLTALEYNNKAWAIYHYAQDELARSLEQKQTQKEEPELEKATYNNKQLFKELVEEFALQTN